MRHKWNNDNECTCCGIGRQKQTRKTLMAIHRGRDVYKYTYEYKYFLTDGKETWDRPTVCWRTTFDD